MRNLILLLLCTLCASTVTSQTLSTSNLPIILIDTQGKSIVNEPKITAKMKVINNTNQLNNITDTNFEYDGYIGIEIRGFTSKGFDKKSYGLETRTATGENLNTELLGLPSENDWVFHGPYSDKSLMRNVLAYHLGNAQGRWSPRTRFFELVVNNEYRGVYVLVEKIKIDKNRVNIAKLKPEDVEGDELTGGYIMSIDRINPGTFFSPFIGRTGHVAIPFTYVDPGYDELTQVQRDYIREYITDFEYALKAPNFDNQQSGYYPYVDVLSFVDYMIMTEISRDLDGYRCSVYFHKDKDSKGGKLVMSPMWDYNLGFGNGDFFQAQNPVGWTSDGIGNGDATEIPFWWDRLREDEFYNTTLKYRWNELRHGAFSKTSINAFIDSCATLLDAAQKRNFQKFNILNSKVWPNPYVGGNYPNEVNYLKTWISDRLDWLDSQMKKIVPSFAEGANEKVLKTNIATVFPNPFTTQATFQINLTKNANVDLHVRNVLGEVLIHRSQACGVGNNEMILNAEECKLQNGLYLYTIEVDGKVFQSGKLVKKWDRCD